VGCFVGSDFFCIFAVVMKERRKLIFFKVKDSDVAFEAHYAGKIKAGFASPAQDYCGESIDLNRLMIKNKDYTFIGKVEGDSMIDDSLNDGDFVIIDRSLEPDDKDAVLVFINDEFTIKHVEIDRENDRIWLVPANRDFPRIPVTPDSEFRIWGVVTYSITKHRKIV
jgi:DNA polymerase V